MFSIAQFFARIQNVRSKEVFVRSAIQNTINEVLKVNIPLEAITFKSTTVELKNIPQTLRSVIFIKKGALLKAINEAQAIRQVTDIR
jgi:hypothetical protein